MPSTQSSLDSFFFKANSSGASKKREAPPAVAKNAKPVKQHRRVIDDDDEDDDNKAAAIPKTPLAPQTSKAEKITTVTPPAAEREVDPVAQEDLQRQAQQLAKAFGAPSNEKLLEQLQGEPAGTVEYARLAKLFEQIEGITGRLEIQNLVTTLFRQVLLQQKEKAKDDLLALVYLCSNSVAPAYECVELGIGDSILCKAIGEAYGTSLAMVKQKYEREGDLGIVAQSYKSKQSTLSFGFKAKPLSCVHVLETFRAIAKITGSSSQKLKADKIKRLLVQCQSGVEAKYIIRGLQGKLRIGLAASTVLISLAQAVAFTVPATVSPQKDKMEEETTPAVAAFLDGKAAAEKRVEAAVQIFKQVYSQVPSYDALVAAAVTTPLAELPTACPFTPGIPVVPMLAKPTKSIPEVLRRLENTDFTCEYKYDGERAQIHRTLDGSLKVFSRNLLETSQKYPEVSQYVWEAAQQAATGTVEATFVLDAEVVAYNTETQQLVPFQVLSTRKKTQDSNQQAEVQVIVQAFDLMYWNGKSLLGMPFAERRALLKEKFAVVPHKFQYATAKDFLQSDGTADGDTSQLQDFLDAAIKGQCEGLMVKTLADVYEPSRRSLNWLKLKKDYLQGLGDSFDLVVLGAYWGRGKRTGVYGAYLLGCYDPDTEEYQSVCKIGTGFSDENLKDLTTKLNEHTIPSKSSVYQVAEGLECDVWFDAVQVWEIKAADLSQSSLHRGARGKLSSGDRGIGLRFPRFERIRDDKQPDQATTSDQILEMYYQQDSILAQQKQQGDDDDYAF